RVVCLQAEDGIRGPLVTGVQTCALPISAAALAASASGPASIVGLQGWLRRSVRADLPTRRPVHPPPSGPRLEGKTVARDPRGARSEERRVGKEGACR